MDAQRILAEAHGEDQSGRANPRKCEAPSMGAIATVSLKRPSRDEGTSLVHLLPIPKRLRKIVNAKNLRNGVARQNRDSPPGESQLSRLKASVQSKHPQMMRFGCF